MNEHLDLWKFLAGLGIFLFGMHLLEESVKSLSGKTFRRMIRQYTNGTLRAIGSGSLVTAVLQSSSAVSLMVLAFVGAGVLSMENAIGVMMGSNIGTTFTAWIVATLGFKVKIESFALPLMGIGGVGLIFLGSYAKLFQFSKLLFGFGFLFLGLDYMKLGVEGLAQSFNLDQISGYGLWLYLLVGIVITALMQSSSASIAIVLTALNSQLINFDMGVAMAIGANVGTTITVLLGSIGAVQSKKRVGFSHVIFNVVTAVVAFSSLPALVWCIELFFNISSNNVMGLALFHTLFNTLGVVIFFPFVGLVSRILFKIFPDHKAILTLYIDKTPTAVPDAATMALKKEIHHLLEESQFYNLRMLKIDEKLVFDNDCPFEKNAKKKMTLDKFYENIKLLHAEIFTFYSGLQNEKLDRTEAKELERVIYASRNIMNSIKNLKGIQHNFDEFDNSENLYLNSQYKIFRKRLLEVYHDMSRIVSMENKEEQYRNLLTAFLHIEETDNRFIKNTINAVSEKKVQEMEISSLLLVNRLFTQACRMQIYAMKDLLLSQEQINDFDRAMDMKEIMDAEKAKTQGDSE
jgi:phosphate:Na+ symporter